MVDETNPRSLVFQLSALAQSIDNLPRGDHDPARNEAQRLVLPALTRLRVAEIGPLARTDKSGYRGDLERLLDGLEDEIPRISEALSQHYFTHLQRPRQFSNAVE